MALVVAVVSGVVSKDQAFAGIGHPATVIIALVLVVSRGLSSSGAIELLARYLVDKSRSVAAHIGLMSGVAAALFGVMNNVAALALLMPIDIQAAARAKRSASLALMPLSFATILGGMVTLIGTPPNIVIASIREQALGESFGMFDFAPVGGAVAVVGIALVALIGWRLLPKRLEAMPTEPELKELEGDVAEAALPEASELLGKRVRELYRDADDSDVSILGLVRNGRRLIGSSPNQRLIVGDWLVLEGGPGAIEQFVGATGLEYAAGTTLAPDTTGKAGEEAQARRSLSDDVQGLIEVVVPEGAFMVGQSASGLRLAYRQGVMLLGVARQGRNFRERVRRLVVKPGDILLLSGPEERLSEVASYLGCLPLTERGLEMIQRDKAWLAIGIFAGAIVLASIGLVYLPIALGGAVVAYVLLGIVPPARLYDSVEWPIIILLGSLISIGAALETSGGTTVIAEAILRWTEGFSALAVLAILMVVTMTLSDVLNNVATALIAGPIAIEIAGRLQVNPDPFLMAVAVAASCAFLTPIGHKNNTIVMGPGGYRFGDYWRMGLPLEILVVAVSIPVILWAWPL